MKTKTTYTGLNVTNFINSYVDNEQKKADSFKLIELMSGWSGFEAEMWGPTIIGFGTYHYKYASGHEGDAPILGFLPEKLHFPCMCIPRQKRVKRLYLRWENSKWRKPVYISGSSVIFIFPPSKRYAGNL